MTTSAEAKIRRINELSAKIKKVQEFISYMDEASGKAFFLKEVKFKLFATAGFSFVRKSDEIEVPDILHYYVHEGAKTLLNQLNEELRHELNEN